MQGVSAQCVTQCQIIQDIFMGDRAGDAGRRGARTDLWQRVLLEVMWLPIWEWPAALATVATVEAPADELQQDDCLFVNARVV